MSTNKNKQNLRYMKISERLNKKVRYDRFTTDEVKLIKAKKQYEQIEKELNKFWAEAPRNNSGQVNWGVMDENTLDYFEYIQKQFEKLFKRISKFENAGIDIDETMRMFLMLNCNSVSY